MYSVVVIGGGLAGLAAAVEARKHTDNVAVIERSEVLGGRTAIEGLKEEEECKSSISDIVNYYIEKTSASNVDIFFGRHVESIKKEDVFDIDTGVEKITAKSIVFATGCKDKTRFMLNITGDRVSGVFTADTALTLLKNYERSIGSKVIIIGNGARARKIAKLLSNYGIEIAGVYAPKNIIKENLDRVKIIEGIPFYLDKTVTEIRGNGRVEEVLIGSMYDGTLIQEDSIKCDTVVIAAGLVPNTKNLLKLGAIMDPATKGPVVNELLETSIEGIFSAGCILTGSYAPETDILFGKIAGKNAAMHSEGKLVREKYDRLLCEKGIIFAVPQLVSGREKMPLILKLDKPSKSIKIRVGNVEKNVTRKTPTDFFTIQIPPIEPTENMKIEIIN